MTNKKYIDVLARRHVLPLVWGNLAEQKELCVRVVPGHATSEFVRFVPSPDGGWAVVRGYNRVLSPLGFRGRFQRFRLASDLNKLLHEQGFPVPRVLVQTQGIDWRTWRQYWFSVEEFVVGTEVTREQTAVVKETFALMGRMHSIRCADAGRSWTSEQFLHDQHGTNPIPRLLKRTERLTKRSNLPVAASEWSRLLAWMEKRLERVIAVGGTRPFALVHGDCRVSNVLANGANPVLIDFMHSRFDLGGAELISTLSHFAGNCPNRAERYLAAYRSQIAPELEQQLHEGLLLFNAMNIVDHLDKMPKSKKYAAQLSDLLRCLMESEESFADPLGIWGQSMEVLGMDKMVLASEPVVGP